MVRVRGLLSLPTPTSCGWGLLGGLHSHLLLHPSFNPLSFLFLSISSPCLSVKECRERWTRERVGVQEWVNEWVSELVGALPWPSHELDMCAFGWGQVISQGDTSHFYMGWFYRMLRHNDGLSGGVGLLSNRDWTLSGHANELVDGPVVLADRPSSQQWADWMQNLVQFSF